MIYNSGIKWKINFFFKKKEELVNNWDTEVHTEQIISHHSFDTFFKLLNSSIEPIVQIWALLNIENMCQFNSDLFFYNLSVFFIIKVKCSFLKLKGNYVIQFYPIYVSRRWLKNWSSWKITKRRTKKWSNFALGCYNILKIQFDRNKIKKKASRV